MKGCYLGDISFKLTLKHGTLGKYTSITSKSTNFILGNAQSPTYSIVYCSDGFNLLTHYSRASVMSKCCACQFLWGPQTKDSDQSAIWNALTSQSEAQLSLFLYKRTGESFLCDLEVTPIKNEKAKVVLYLFTFRQVESLGVANKQSSKVILANKNPRMGANLVRLNTNANPFKSFSTNNLLRRKNLSERSRREPISPNNATVNSLDNSALLLTSGIKCSANSLQPIDKRNCLTPNFIAKSRSFRASRDGQTWLDPKQGDSKSCQQSALCLAVEEEPCPHHCGDGAIPLDPEEEAQLQSNNQSTSNSDVEELSYSHESGMNPPSSSLHVTNEQSFDTRVKKTTWLDESSENVQKSSVEPDFPNYNFNRRKAIAIPYGLPRKSEQDMQFRPSRLRNFKKFSGNNIPEYKVQQLTKSRSIIWHFSCWRTLWDWAMLLASLYIAFTVPYRQTFARTDRSMFSSQTSSLLVFDLLIEVMFIIDIVMNFRTTYVNKSGQIVVRQSQLTLHYLRGFFLIDLLAALPTECIKVVLQLTSEAGEVINETAAHSIQLSTGFKTVSASIRNSKLTYLQLLKMVRVIRMLAMVQNFSRLSEHSVIILSLLMSAFTLVAHWCACIWYLIGQHEYNKAKIGWLSEMTTRMRSPVTPNSSLANSSQLGVGAKYFTALYFACTSLTSVGFGNVSANTTLEKVFAICLMLLGALMHAAVFGNVTAIIQRIYARRTAFQSKTQDLQHFCQVHRIPKSLKRRMVDFFQTMWALNHGTDPDEILRIYPEELRKEVALYLNQRVLGMRIFESTSESFRKNLAIHIKSTFGTPGEYVIHSGDIINKLFFVTNGSLEISVSGEVVALLGKNDWFGTYIDTGQQEVETKPARSRCDVKALTYCDLQTIDLTALSQVLGQYPEFKNDFEACFQDDLSFDIRENPQADLNCTDLLIPALTLQNASETKSSASSSTFSTSPNDTLAWIDLKDSLDCPPSQPTKFHIGSSDRSSTSDNHANLRCSPNNFHNLINSTKKSPSIRFIKENGFAFKTDASRVPSLQASKSCPVLNSRLIESTRQPIVLTGEDNHPITVSSTKMKNLTLSREQTEPMMSRITASRNKPTQFLRPFGKQADGSNDSLLTRRTRKRPNDNSQTSLNNNSNRSINQNETANQRQKLQSVQKELFSLHKRLTTLLDDVDSFITNTN